MNLLKKGGGVIGDNLDVSVRGEGTLLLTYADKRGEGVKKSENIADIICERSLSLI